MQRKIILLLVSVILAAAALAGCGGSDESPTKKEFVVQANKVCVKGYAEAARDLQRAAGQIDTGGRLLNKAEQITVIEATVPPLREMVDQMESLDQPSDEADQVGAIVVAFDGAVRKVEDDPSLAVPRPNYVSPFVEANKKAIAYGMKQCAKL